MNPMLHIRTKVFRVSQGEIARIAQVNQTTVSRWERGELEPDRMELQRLSEEAEVRGLDWDTSLFFKVPTGSLSGAAA